jgi:hypothetical protein
MAGVQVGVGYIDIKPDMSGFSRELKGDLSRDLAVAGNVGGKSLGTSLGASMKGALLGIGATIGAKAVFDMVGGMIDAASELGETVSKSNNVFKSSAKEITAWAAGGAKDFGLSQNAALAAASGFGNMFAQLGIGLDTSAAMSTSIVELAADFASFHNADITQVLDAQSAAFRGEYDSLQRFLPLINAATVEQRALEMTGKRATKELTAQEKALAVNALMLEGAGEAAGDFDRTSGSLANSQRTLSAEWENAQAALGQGLMPIMTDFVTFLTEDGIPGFLKLIEVIGEGFADAIGFALQGIGFFGNAVADLLEPIDQWVFGMEGIPEKLKLGSQEATKAAARLHDFHVELNTGVDATDAATGSMSLFEKGIALVTVGLADSVPVVDLHAEAIRDHDKAVRDAASAERDLDEARRDYNELLARGAVDEEKVTDARQSLAEASRSAARANRELADTQEDYDQAKAAADILGTDTAMEALEDAADDLADAQDNVASAAEREAEAQRDLREAQAGDPDFQDKLADAKDRVADASDRIWESNQKVAETSAGVVTAAGQVGVALDTLGEKAEEAGRDLSDLFWLGGHVVGAVGDFLGRIPESGGSPIIPAPAPTPTLTQPGTAALFGSLTSPAPTATTNIFDMTFNEKADPKEVAAQISWMLAGIP